MVWLTSLSLLFAAVGLNAAERYQSSQPHMGTVATITLYAESFAQAQAAYNAAFQRIAVLDRSLSDYNTDSELSRACEGIVPSRDLFKVLRFAQELSNETGGAFDITSGNLSVLWRLAWKSKQLPDSAAVRAAAELTGHRNLELNPLRCAKAGMKLDAGGIAKGYAADEALAVLREKGVPHALVAISGDIAIGDAPPGKPGWVVEVSGQRRTLSNAAVSTSGNAFQYLEVGGVRYSHIFDPRTGQALTHSNEVAVIAPTGMEADAVATAVSVGGEELAEKLRARRKIEILIR